MTNHYHCCATCIHYKVIKTEGYTKRRCERLRYETQPHYQFGCWEPKE